MRKVVGLAKKGDAVALKLCVERLLPARAARDRWVQLDVPSVRAAADLVAASAAVVERCASGEITLSEAKEFMSLIDAQRRAIETADLAVRIEALEGGPAAGGRVVDPEQLARVRRIIETHREGDR